MYIFASADSFPGSAMGYERRCLKAIHCGASVLRGASPGGTTTPPGSVHCSQHKITL